MRREDILVVAPELPLREGASGRAISQAEADLEFTLPHDYQEFLRASNGACGMAGAHHYVDLWRVEELMFSNRASGLLEFCPEVVAFGSNGGGEAFVFRRDNSRIAMVPFIGMKIEVAIDIAGEFLEFLRDPRPKRWQ